MSKALVIEVDQSAKAERTKPYGWAIVTDEGEVLGRGTNAKVAWEDAAVRVRSQSDAGAVTPRTSP